MSLLDERFVMVSTERHGSHKRLMWAPWMGIEVVVLVSP
jgi:hypothetical protein